MKILKLLKNASGKIVMGVPQLAAIAGVGMLAVYGAYETDSTYASKEAPIRTLSGITRSSVQEGLQQKDGLLTSINVKDSLNQVATPEERAALEAQNGFSSQLVDQTENQIANWNPGAAAGSAQTEGLGMGANETVMQGPAGAPRAASSLPSVNGGRVAAAAAQGGATQPPALGSASMARASGSAFNAASGPIASSGSGTRSASASGGAAGSGEGYHFSGAMPSGSNAVSAMAGGQAFGAGSATFMAGGRYATTSRGPRSFREKNDLRDIAKRSADAAGNRTRSANEGSRAFLASTRNSGGMAVEGGVAADNGGASSDFEPARAAKLRAIDDWADQEDDFAEKQEKARKRLMWMVLALVAVSVAAIPIAYNLIAEGTKPGLFGVSFALWGKLILLSVMLYAATVIGFGVDYDTKYNGQMMPLMSYILGAASIGAMLFTWRAAVKNAGDKAVKTKFNAGVAKALKTVGVMGVEKLGSSLAQEVMNEQPSTTKKK